MQEATERFRTIQSAYAVLTDDNEKAWYDSHREDIIGGESATSDRLVNVFAYFSADSFDGFDDSPGGFYAVFTDVFSRIAAAEARYAEPDAPTLPPAPVFGDASAGADIVSGFYASWKNYSSRMTFAWADEHNPLEAPNRNVKRAMEKENKKLRDAARRERSESVRALVAFCQRRDKRYIQQLLDARRWAEEEEAKRRAVQLERQRAAAEVRAALAAEHAREAEARELEVRASGAYRLADDDGDGGRRRGGGGRKRAALEASREVPGLIVRAEVLAPVDLRDGGCEDAASSDAVSVFLCAPCEKSFRSTAALINHEASKKHVQMLRALGISMQPPAAVVSGIVNEVVATTDSETPADTKATTNITPVIPLASLGTESLDVSVASAQQRAVDVNIAPFLSGAEREHLSDSSDSSELVHDSVARLSGLAGLRLSSKVVSVHPAATDSTKATETLSGDSSSSDSDDSDDRPRGGRGKTKNKKSARATARKHALLLASLAPAASERTESSAVHEGCAEAAAEAPVTVDAGSVAQAKQRKSRRAAKTDKAAPPGPTEGSVASLLASSAGRKGKAEQRPQLPHKPLNIAGAGFAADSALCELCGERFETRNALFVHIRATGHAALRDDRSGVGSRAARKAAR